LGALLCGWEKIRNVTYFSGKFADILNCKENTACQALILDRQTLTKEG
jgi:hypothetical protein